MPSRSKPAMLDLSGAAVEHQDVAIATTMLEPDMGDYYDQTRLLTPTGGFRAPRDTCPSERSRA